MTGSNVHGSPRFHDLRAQAQESPSDDELHTTLSLLFPPPVCLFPPLGGMAHPPNKITDDSSVPLNPPSPPLGSLPGLRAGLVTQTQHLPVHFSILALGLLCLDVSPVH